MIAQSTPSRSVRSMVTPEGAVLLDLSQNLCISLNPVGGFIWERLQASKPPAEILTELQAAFADVEPQTLSRDLDAFIADLTSARLLTAVTP
jgi:Coenzyme PQQ synthesis protein D (PqqD)